MAYKAKELTARQMAFIDAYMKHGNGTQASKDAGYSRKTDGSHGENASSLLKNPKVAAEIARRQEEMRSESIATAQQVMEFFTKAMNGEIKDQFGLDATLGDRIKAGQELAKRTIDLENKIAGKQDSTVRIVLDWGRENDDEDTENV